MPEIPREQEIYYEKKLTPEVVEPEVDLMVVNPEWSAKRLNSGWPNQAPDSRARNRARTQHYFNICLKDWLDHLWDTRYDCLLYTSPSPRDRQKSRMPSSA